MSHSSKKTSKLDQIKAEILEKNVCPNLAQTATQLVVGDGNADADVMFIGEAPGAKEDQTGIPFVGAAGKFLDEMLESIGMKREDVYITNIVKYRPPNNRDPEPAEKEEFLPYLHKQIAVIEPKLVVALGRHSMNSFVPNARISQVHGRAFRGVIKGAVFMPLYHPAAALYNGSMREVLKEDFSGIPLVLNKI